MTVMTALKEANQAGSLQPTTLVSYDADLQPLFDTHDAQALFEYGIDTKTLGATTWRDEMKMMGEAPTQRLARDLKKRWLLRSDRKKFCTGHCCRRPQCHLVEMGTVVPPPANSDRRRQ